MNSLISFNRPLFAEKELHYIALIAIDPGNISGDEN